ncbi:MAG: hypothetical protein M1482_06550 [Chloroflexi bacterium]|nr:hypothetical protein [Chloroflexota bacterium]
MNKSTLVAFFVFLFSVYMLTYSRTFDVRADEGTMFAVTESLAKFGRTSIDQANNLQYLSAATMAPDGSHYSKYGIGQSNSELPLYGLALAVPALGLVDTVLLLNPLLTALSATCLLLTAWILGASRGRALAVALLYSFCTPGWVYAKSFYSEPLTGLGFAIAALGVAVLLTRPRAWGAAIAGVGLAVAMLAKSSAVVTVPALVFVAVRYGGGKRWKNALASLAPVAAAVVVVAVYNWARFGNPAQSGYGDEGFTVYPWVGALGMLFAPGRSLFIYAPIMLAALPGVWLLRRPAGLRLWIAGTVGSVMLLEGAWWAWWGAWAWGPRFLVPVLPLLSLGLLGVLPSRAPRGTRAEWTRDWTCRAKLGALSLLAALSLLMQVPGVSVYRALFFWNVMRSEPNLPPDVVSLYTFRFSMPAFNLEQAIQGNLDVAWKPGANALVDAVGLLFAASAASAGLIALILAWRGGRAGRAAALGGVLLVGGLTAAGIAHYGQLDENPYPAVLASTVRAVPAGAIVFVGNTSAGDNRMLWNVNRTRLDLVGVSPDRGQMQLHALPVVRRAVALGQAVWYLQTEPNAPADFFDELTHMRLCSSTWPLESPAKLFEWKPCAQ